VMRLLYYRTATLDMILSTPHNFINDGEGDVRKVEFQFGGA